MKSIENKDFLTALDVGGHCMPVKTPAAFQQANKINGFVHISYGTALAIFKWFSQHMSKLSGLLITIA